MKINRLPSVGSQANCSRTIADRPANPFRMSVALVHTKIFEPTGRFSMALTSLLRLPAHRSGRRVAVRDRRWWPRCRGRFPVGHEFRREAKPMLAKPDQGSELPRNKAAVVAQDRFEFPDSQRALRQGVASTDKMTEPKHFRRHRIGRSIARIERGDANGRAKAQLDPILKYVPW